jgi:hypothetical protein
MMANAKPKKDVANPGVFDVSKPGKSAPTATAKPIIVTNRPMLQDPMVVEESGKETESPAKAKVTIQPITITSADDAESDDKITVTTSETKSEEPKQEPTEPVAPPQPKPAAEVAAPAERPDEVAPVEEPKPEPVPVPDKEKAEEPAPEGTEEVTDKPLAPGEEDAAAKKAEEEKAEHEAAISKLVENQQYFLPINSVEGRKTKRFIALGILLILVLGVAWVDIALDAGLVHIGGLKAVTHFFTN